MERALPAGDLARRPVELVLEDVGEEVARVLDVRRDVEFAARVEVVGASLDGGLHALVLFPERPPAVVVRLRRQLAREDLPPPPVHEESERKERDAAKGL